MYLFDQRQNKTLINILITENFIFFLTSRFALIRKYLLQSLHSIVSVASNASILALKFRPPRQDSLSYNIRYSKTTDNNKDCMLETYRRTEFIVFLLNNADVNKR